MSDWINVADITPRIAYTATASQTLFTVPFVFFAEADLKVYQNGTLLTLATHYTTAGAEDEDGGTITLLTGATVGDEIMIVRDLAIEQTTHIPPSGPLDIPAINVQLSKLIAIDQQAADKQERSVHFPDSDSTLSGELASVATRKNTLLGFDTNGELIYTLGPTFVADTDVGVADIDSRATAQVTVIGASVNVIQTGGYAIPGDGRGALYKRVGSMPTSGDFFQSADGAWWSAVAGGASSTDFATRAEAIATPISADATFIRTAGYYAAGDGGGALFKRVVSLASGVIGFQSADGAWWQIAERDVSTAMAGAMGDGTTDDTAAIQAAIDSTPTGGTLYIQESFIYNGTGQYIGGCLISDTLIVNRPMNITGGGMYSNLKTDASFPTTQANLLVQENATYWYGITFSNFAIGNDTVAVPYTRYGGIGIQIYSVGLAMPRMRFENLHIGESGNDYSFWIDGVGTQQCVWEKNLIAGGLYLNNVADSQIIQNNVFAGRSVRGVLINMNGAGGLQFKGNTVTAVGGVVIQSSSLPVIADNYFEELLGFPINNATLVDGTHPALLALTSTTSAIVAAAIRDNIFNMGQSASPARPIFISATTLNTHIVGNEFNNSNNGNSGSIQSASTTLMGGPNYYLQSTHLVGGGSWANNYGSN